MELTLYHYKATVESVYDGDTGMKRKRKVAIYLATLDIWVSALVAKSSMSC